MQKVVLATGNPGKVRELADLLSAFGLDIVAQTELGVESAEETGLTFKENAEIKAHAGAAATGLPWPYEAEAVPEGDKVAAIDITGVSTEGKSPIAEIDDEKLAELCAAHKDRFAAFASLSLQFPDLAVQQLETAVKKQGLKGAAIGGSVANEEFSDPKFHPVWAKAEELGAALFIHPQSTPQLASRFKGNGWLANTIGNPLDTTIALQRLIFEGTLDKYPGLKIIAAHGGGYLGSYAPRSDHACFVSPANCNPDIKLKKKPTEYLNQLYFDALVFTPEALRHLVAQVGASQVMLGSDHPIPWEQHPVDHVFATSTLSSKEKAAILGLNAARLLNIPTS